MCTAWNVSCYYTHSRALFVHVAAQAACPACMPAAQPAMGCVLLQGVVNQRQPLCPPRRCSERQYSRYQGRLSKGALSLTARLTARLASALSAGPAIRRTDACNKCISSACLSLRSPWLKADCTRVCAAGKGVAPGRAPGPRSQCQLCAAALCVPGGGLPCVRCQWLCLAQQ